MSTPDNPFEQIIIPTDIPSAWPPAPIYWLLLVLAIISVVLAIYFIRRHFNKQKVIKQALASLQSLQKQQANFAQLNQLLKGLSLQYYTRSQVASLTGNKWFHFLQQHNAQGNAALFNNQDEFCQRLYQPTVSSATQQDFDAARVWIQAFPEQVNRLRKSNAAHHQLSDSQHV